MNRILIIHRADDDPSGAGRVHDRLETELGSGQLGFVAEDTTQPSAADMGTTPIVAASEIVLAIIGPRWLAAPRLANETAGGIVDNGIAAALKLGKSVVPVLIGDAIMPRPDQLPPDLVAMSRLHAVRLRHSRFVIDCDALAQELRNELAQIDSGRQRATEQAAGDTRAKEAQRQREEARRLASVGGQTEEQVVSAEERANWSLLEAQASSREVRDHLARFPGGDLESHALARLEQLAWEGFAADGRAEDLRRFLAEFPSGANAGNARERLKKLEADAHLVREALEKSASETRSWATASSVHTIKGYASFLGEWPHGAYAAFARARERELRKGRARLWFVVWLSVPGLFLGAHALVRSVPAWVAVVQDWNSRPVFRNPEMVTVPAGEFVMGSPPDEDGGRKDEGPQRRVAIEKPFQIGKYEVTFAEWDVCAAEKGCKHSPSANGWGRGRRPAIFVSWDDAQEYVAWLSKRTKTQYRLPTEAEWEYAARAGSSTRYAFGDAITNVQAQFATDRTAPAGSFKPNAFGIHDMHGNVWEWVQDCFKSTYDGAPIDGSASAIPCTDRARVVRGGSWFNRANDLRAARRDSDSADMRYDILGFRLARSLAP